MFVSLFTLPYLIGVAVVAAIISFFIGKSLKSKNELALQTRIDELASSLKNKEKESKGFKKDANRFKSEKDNISSKYEKLKADYDPVSKEAATLKSQHAELEVEKESHLSTIARLQNDLKTSKEKFEITNRRLSEIQKDDKSWKREIDGYKKSSEQFEKNWKAAEDRKVQLSRKLKEYGDTDEQIKQLQYDLKSHKLDLKRVTKDLAYWEKQHYDTQHSLTAATAKLEQLAKDQENQIQLNNGLKIKEENMLKLVEEYKTKLINANNKLYDIKKKQEVFN